MKKLLVIYNTCGISGRENHEHYIQCLNGILNQQFNDFDVVVSDCLNSNKVRHILKDIFKDRMFFNCIDTKMPVNCSFNFTAYITTKKIGNYEGYLYMDSGVDISSDLLILQKLYDKLSCGKYSLVAGKVDNDLVNYFELPSSGQDFEVPLGKAINLHLQVFSKLFFDSYGKRLMPDIFAGHCSESVLSFMAAAIKTKWILCDNVLGIHKLDLDVQSSGYDPAKHHMNGKPTWLHSNIISDKVFLNRVASDQSRNLGLGYEEVRRISMHNTNAFDNNGYSISNDLKDYIRNNLFLREDELNYDQDIRYSFC